MNLTAYGPNDPNRPDNPDFARIVDAVLWLDANASDGTQTILTRIGLNSGTVGRYAAEHGNTKVDVSTDHIAEAVMSWVEGFCLGYIGRQHITTPDTTDDATQSALSWFETPIGAPPGTKPSLPVDGRSLGYVAKHRVIKARELWDTGLPAAQYFGALWLESFAAGARTYTQTRPPYTTTIPPRLRG